MPELGSLSNIRYRPQTHTATSPLHELTILQVRSPSPVRVKHALIHDVGYIYAHQHQSLYVR